MCKRSCKEKAPATTGGMSIGSGATPRISPRMSPSISSSSSSPRYCTTSPTGSSTAATSRRGRVRPARGSQDDAVITRVCDIIGTMSFKGAGVPSAMRTREGMVVQDADRLDAIGAIGIARTFAYGGHMNRDIWDPAREPQAHASAEDYLAGTGSTIDHFYEKLLLLKDRMNTETGRRMANERHAFMKAYLERFYTEWEGTV